MIIADDGGASVSVNNGKTWSLQNNLPTAQIYRLNADNLFPYNVYAGQQDNTSFRLASRQQGSSGIDNTSLSYSAGEKVLFWHLTPTIPGLSWEEAIWALLNILTLKIWQEPMSCPHLISILPSSQTV